MGMEPQPLHNGMVCSPACRLGGGADRHICRHCQSRISGPIPELSDLREVILSAVAVVAMVGITDPPLGELTESLDD
jgi:hypothetical protein